MTRNIFFKSYAKVSLLLKRNKQNFPTSVNYWDFQKTSYTKREAAEK